MSPTLKRAALTLKEQAVLAVLYRVRWSQSESSETVKANGQISFRKGRDPGYGATRDLARRVIAGEFGDASCPEVIAAERERRAELGLPEVPFSDASLRNTIWKMRNDKQGKTRREAAA